MNLTNLLNLCRLKVPAAKSDVISDANALILLNNGLLEITRETKCLPTYGEFNTAADTMEYSLTAKIPNYLCPLDEDIMHVYYYDGSEHTELDIVTIGYLDSNYSGWQDAGSGDPERCVILGDTFYLHPKPATAITKGVKLYHCQKPTPMDISTNVYPWNGETEISRLSPFHTVLLAYFEKEVYEILDINEPNSPRRSRAQTKYLEMLAWMGETLKKDVNIMLLRSKQTRLKLSSNYGQNPF